MPEMHETLRPPVEPVDAAAPGPYPQIALSVLDDALNQVIGQAIVISRLILVNDKRISVITVQSLARSKPHKTPAVLHGTDDIAMRQSLRRSQMYKGEIITLRSGAGKHEQKQEKA